MSTARPQNGTQGSYERSDAEARPVILSAFVLTLLLALAMAASAWLSQELGEELAREEPPSPVHALRAPPEGPALQALPARELAAHRAREERLLTGTEWVDPVNQIVRIPIERALELCLEEGFPVRAEARAEERR
jgi:hypothetical protein